MAAALCVAHLYVPEFVLQGMVTKHSIKQVAKNWLYKTWGSLFLQTGSVYSLYKVSVKLVKSANKRKHCVVVVVA